MAEEAIRRVVLEAVSDSLSVAILSLQEEIAITQNVLKIKRHNLRNLQDQKIATDYLIDDSK